MSCMFLDLLFSCQNGCAKPSLIKFGGSDGVGGVGVYRFWQFARGKICDTARFLLYIGSYIFCQYFSFSIFMKT